MIAAEDLLLSAKLYNLKGGYVIHDDGSRCAIGCLVPADNEGGVWSVMKAIRKKYPWMLVDRGDLKCPCCDEPYLKVMHALGHVFDSHVYFAHDMTLEQLANWIDQQDPTPREPVGADGAPHLAITRRCLCHRSKTGNVEVVASHVSKVRERQGTLPAVLG